MSHAGEPGTIYIFIDKVIPSAFRLSYTCDSETECNPQSKLLNTEFTECIERVHVADARETHGHIQYALRPSHLTGEFYSLDALDTALGILSFIEVAWKTD